MNPMLLMPIQQCHSAVNDDTTRVLQFPALYRKGSLSCGLDLIERWVLHTASCIS